MTAHRHRTPSKIFAGRILATGRFVGGMAGAAGLARRDLIWCCLCLRRIENKRRTCEVRLNLQECFIELFNRRLISMIFLFDNVVPKLSHLPDFRPLFWIGSKASVAILAKRRSIIDVIATAHLEGECGEYRCQSLDICNSGKPPSFLLGPSGLAKMAFLNGR